MPFVWIHADIPLPERYRAAAKRYRYVRGALAGQLQITQRRDADPAPVGDPDLGFHSRVLEGFAVGPEEMLKEGDRVFAQNYPCVDGQTLESEGRVSSDEDYEDD